MKNKINIIYIDDESGRLSKRGCIDVKDKEKKLRQFKEFYGEDEVCEDHDGDIIIYV